MKIEIITDAINTYEQIKKDLETYLGKAVSGSETITEETITAIKARIVNIRDVLIPAHKASLAKATEKVQSDANANSPSTV